MADETEDAKPAAKPKPAKLDSVKKGSLDLWPLLKLDTPALVAKVVAGDCDGFLSELEEMAAAHPTIGTAGFERRGTVIDACQARKRRA